MAPVKPHMFLTEKVKAESRERHEYVFSCPSSLSLSFAVWLIDDYTQKEPLGKVVVGLKDADPANVKIVKNLSGYHTFSGLPEGEHTLRVESELYFFEERLVDTRSFAGSMEPVVEITLKPRPQYPFPDNATLIRGMLTADPVVLTGITIKATLKMADLKTQEVSQGIPDEKGEFVLYFKEGITGKADIDLEIKGKGTKKIPVYVEEGKSISVGTIPIS